MCMYTHNINKQQWGSGSEPYDNVTGYRPVVCSHFTVLGSLTMCLSEKLNMDKDKDIFNSNSSVDKQLLPDRRE